jgi:cold shock CspA family protein
MNNQGVFQWVQSAGGGANDFARGFEIAPDDEGNLVATGFFSNVLNVADHSIVSNGGQFDFDIYLLKFDYEGTVTWARNAGGYGMDHGRDLFVLPNGEIYLTGFFSGTGFFGEIMVEAYGMADVFMAKYDTYGEIDHVVVGGGLGNDYGYGITGDGLGNLYLTGVFEDDATFGGTVLQAVGDKDIFVAKIPGETSGVSGGALPGGMIIYPNPAKDMLVVNTGSIFENQYGIKFKISDMLGKLLIEPGHVASNDKKEIFVDISSLRPGAYLIKLFNENFSLSGKFIIED